MKKNPFLLSFFGVLFVAAIIRICFGDQLTLFGDDESYYLASRAILQKGNLFAGAEQLRDIYSFRYLSTWLSALSWKAFGESVFFITLPQVISSLGLVALTVFFTQRYLSWGWAIMAGLFASFNPMGIQLTQTLSPDGHLALFSFATLFILLFDCFSNRYKNYLFAGLIFCLSYWTKEESAKHLFPLLLVVGLKERKAPSSNVLKAVSIFILPIVLSFIADLTMCSIYISNPFARIQAAVENIRMWKRMGGVDPFGRPWSYSFYIRRLLFPFGPFGIQFWLALLGFYYFIKEKKDSILVIWFIVQFFIFILGAKVGQIQERMLQILIPVTALWVVYACHKIKFQKSVTVASLFLSLYIVFCKYDLRWLASPRVYLVNAYIVNQKEYPIYVPEDIRFHFRDRKISFLKDQILNISDLNPTVRETKAVIRKGKIPEGYEVNTIVYEPPVQTSWISLITSPLSQYRKEYAPYQIVKIRRI